MFGPVKNQLVKVKNALPFRHNTPSAKSQAALLQRPPTALYNRSGTVPSPQAWVAKQVNKQNRDPKRWLEAKVLAQARQGGRPLPPQLSQQLTPAQPIEATPVPTATQEHIVQAAVDDYVEQCKAHPGQKPTTGDIAKLWTYIQTGRPWENKGGFHGERRDRIGDEKFRTPLAAVQFLVDHPNLINRLKEVDPFQAQTILNRHRELMKADRESQARGAGL